MNDHDDGNGRARDLCREGKLQEADDRRNVLE